MKGQDAVMRRHPHIQPLDSCLLGFVSFIDSGDPNGIGQPLGLLIEGPPQEGSFRHHAAIRKLQLAGIPSRYIPHHLHWILV